MRGGVLGLLLIAGCATAHERVHFGYRDDPGEPMRTADGRPIVDRFEGLIGEYGTHSGHSIEMYGDGAYRSAYSTHHWTHRDEGHVEFRKGQLHFTQTKVDRKAPLPLLWPVPWGHRLYLVSDRRMPEFLNDVHSPRRDAGPWSMAGIWRDALKSWEPCREPPSIAGPWAKCLRIEPLEGRVIRRGRVATWGEGYWERTRLSWWVDLGERDGIFVGQTLYAVGYEGPHGEHAMVGSVTESECEIVPSCPEVWSMGRTCTTGAFQPDER